MSAVQASAQATELVPRPGPNPGLDLAGFKVLGLSYGYHDASACLVVGGRIIAAVAEERFTRQKHDANFPAFAVEQLLEQTGLRIDDIDLVVYHEDPHTKFSRVLTSSLAPFPSSRKEFVNSVKTWLGKKLWSLNGIAARLRISPTKIRYLGHHFSHAVQAFMGSGFDEAAILVVDAVGDWSCTAMFRGRWVEGKPQIERLVEIAFPHSIGLVYSAFTAYLGFNPNDSECSTMAIAAFGRPKYAGKVRAILGELDGDSYSVDQRYFHFANFYKGAVTDLFLQEFGRGRDAREKLPFSSLGSFDHGREPSEDEQRWADIAASLQLVTEERILQLGRRLHENTGLTKLCYAGGVSLNCVANYKLLSEGPFEQIWIPPDPGDGGTSVGTSLYTCAVEGGGLAPEDLAYGPYIGLAYDEAGDIDMIEHLRPDHFLEYLKRGVVAQTGVKWAHETFASDAELCEHVAQRLMDREIVGWVQGRFEIGPRALGNRSILIRPDDLELALRLSTLVKERAAFRPYAFSISSKDALAVLDIPAAHVAMQRWMQYAVPVKPAMSAKVRAALHVDNTTRPQVCAEADNPVYSQLLRSFGARFGVEVVLNTSFNPSGYPIVATPVEAMAMFARTDMDALVLNRSIIWKQR